MRGSTSWRRTSHPTRSRALGDGAGGFDRLPDLAVANGPRAISVSDLDGDGRLDIAVAHGESHSVSVLFGSGDGTCAGRTDYDTGVIATSIVLGDLNGDRSPDIAVGGSVWARRVAILFNLGDKKFGEPSEIEATDNVSDIAAADLDGDGVLDLLTVRRDGHNVFVFGGNGDGTYRSRLDVSTAWRPLSIAVGDLDGNGRPDSQRRQRARVPARSAHAAADARA